MCSILICVFNVLQAKLIGRLRAVDLQDNCMGDVGLQRLVVSLCPPDNVAVHQGGPPGSILQSELIDLDLSHNR